MKTTSTTLQRPDIRKMQERLQAALANKNILTLVMDDLAYTFKTLGLGTGINDTLGRIINELVTTTDLEATERKIYSSFEDITIGNADILEILYDKLRERAQIVYNQVSPFFRQDESIIDWGCGDGRITNYIYNHISHNVIGYDVRSYLVPEVVAPIKQFGGDTIPVASGIFHAGLMTNVAHHEEHNALILRELARIIRPGGRLVVIETVPIKDDSTEFERTFVGDYIYNRIFHDADIPVPGTYETQEGWVRRFKEVGFDLEELDGIANPTPLGYDQPTIRDWHTRLVLRRCKK